jgi:hypothetical protein
VAVERSTDRWLGIIDQPDRIARAAAGRPCDRDINYDCT